MSKEEVYQKFPVLAVELWEQRANTNVLLSCAFRKEKKEGEEGE